MVNYNLLIAGGALAAGLLLGGGGVRLWYDRAVLPDAIADTIQQQEKLCLERVTDAAEAARATEQLRQRLAGDAATRAFQQSLADAAESAAELGRRLEQEETDYAQILADTGRSCPLDGPTAEWLLNDG